MTLTTWIIPTLIVVAIGWPVGRYLRRRIDRKWSRRGFHTPEAIADFKRHRRWIYEYSEAVRTRGLPRGHDLKTLATLREGWHREYPNEPWPGSR